MLSRAAVKSPVRKPALYAVGDPMPSPLKAGRLDLPLHVKRALVPLMRPDPKAYLVQWALTWATIGGTIFLAWRVHTWWMSLAAIFIVATRQNLLGLLMHDQAHWLAASSRRMDYFCELFVAYPLMVTLEGYRRVHLTHHIDYFTDKDPDYVRKQGKEWTFPQHMAYFVGTLLKDLTGINVVKTLKAKGIDESRSSIPANFYPPRWLKPVFLATLAVLLTVTHTWKLYLLYWLLPLLTIMQVFIRWGAVSEHKYNLVSPSVEESTPLIELRWWEKVLFPNLNFTLHIYHHWFPNIPALSLPKVHQMFRDAGLVDDRYVFHGYGEYIRFLMGSFNEEAREQCRKEKNSLSVLPKQSAR